MATLKSAIAELAAEMSSMATEPSKTPASPNVTATPTPAPPIVEALAPNGIGSDAEGAELDQALCDNFSMLDGRCIQKGSLHCSTCHLVQYCSKKCLTAHATEHKVDCKAEIVQAKWIPSYIKEGRKEAGLTELQESQIIFNNFWGNLPQYDILKLADNEGLNYDKELELCFAASGDLRNLIETVNNIPQTLTFKRNLNIVVNDIDTDLVLRNAVQLFLAFLYPNGEASELIIHLWYSGAITTAMKKALSDKVAPLIKTFCAKLMSKTNDSIFSTKWEFGESSLRIALKRKDWMRLLSVLEPRVPLNFADTEKTRKAAVMEFRTPWEKDRHEKCLFNTPRILRVVDLRNRQTGMLLPFGCTSQAFDTPNPFFYDEKNNWIPTPTPSESQIMGCDPHKLHDTIRSLQLAKNDIHGGLFFQRRAEIKTFCKRITEMKTEICMYNVDAKNLGRTIGSASYHRNDLKFDRIDVSNIGDMGYLGIGPTLNFMAPLLKPSSENPHATLITSFINAIQSMCNTPVTQKTKDLVSRLIPEICWCHANPVQLQRLKKNSEKFEDFDKLWTRYKYRRNFSLSATTGLREKDKHTILKQWPWRLNQNQKFKDLKREFEMYHGLSGGERIVEWQIDEDFKDSPQAMLVRRSPSLYWGANPCERSQQCCGCCSKCDARNGVCGKAGASGRKGKK